jgi:DNA modification methylase
LLAAKQLGLAAVPTIRLPHLSEDQKRALRLADNKIAQNAGWDIDLLRVELDALTSADLTFDLDALGFSSGEIDVVLAGPGHADPDDEIIPPLPAAPRSRLGDIWVLGDHRVGCGDCRDPAFMTAVMAGAYADAAFLDPPYNVKINGHANVRSRHREFAMASGEMSEARFTDFLHETLGACAAVSRDGAVHFVCMDWRHLGELQEAGDEIYDCLINLCVWNKSNAGMGALYRSKHELVLVYRVGQAQHFNAVELGKHGRNRTNVWDYASVNTLRGARRDDLDLHPTVKPVGLVGDAIKDVTRRGEVVLDAFLGSGTTLIAAEREGRRCRGAEIDPVYVDVAIDRWAAMTGCEPVLEARAAIRHDNQVVA